MQNAKDPVEVSASMSETPSKNVLEGKGRHQCKPPPDRNKSMLTFHEHSAKGIEMSKKSERYFKSFLAANVDDKRCEIAERAKVLCCKYHSDSRVAEDNVCPAVERPLVRTADKPWHTRAYA